VARYEQPSRCLGRHRTPESDGNPGRTRP
jgi:hypothetical protein